MLVRQISLVTLALASSTSYAFVPSSNQNQYQTFTRTAMVSNMLKDSSASVQNDIMREVRIRNETNGLSILIYLSLFHYIITNHYVLFSTVTAQLRSW